MGVASYDGPEIPHNQKPQQMQMAAAAEIRKFVVPQWRDFDWWHR